MTSLRDQTVVVIGGTSGIGLESARQAACLGANVIITGRNEERLRAAAAEVHALDTKAFDARDADRLAELFDELPNPIDHVLVTAGGPHYMPIDQMDLVDARRALVEKLSTTLAVAVHSRGKLRPGGTLLFVGGTGSRRPGVGLAIESTVVNALPALIATLAIELAPVRVNLIAPGFVDTPLSAALLGDAMDARREELRRRLPIGRVVGPADVAALAVHLMTNEAITGGSYDIDGGQQLIPR